jgi:hypothetical protein
MICPLSFIALLLQQQQQQRMREFDQTQTMYSQPLLPQLVGYISL